MDPEAPKPPGKYRAYAFILLFMTTLTLYMLYIQSYAQLSQNNLLSALEYPRTKVPKHVETTESSQEDTDSSKYLISSSKCKIPQLNPFNWDVGGFYEKHVYIPCTTNPLLSYVTVNGSHATLYINQSAIPHYTKTKNYYCCYSTVSRKPDKENPDKTIKVSPCKEFKDKVTLSEDVIIVECKNNATHEQIYKNAHAAIRTKENVKKKFKTHHAKKPLSVLFIGIDSVSRLNFMREMPTTRTFMENNHWLELRGYNKVADNTYPNLMAILSGMNETTSYDKCKPKNIGYLDKCKLIWYDYRNLGYITAYAEDESKIGTFNYNKKGFVKPPTDYYFRPYLLAAEQELKTSQLDEMTYCTGPETSGERILHLAKDFAEKFKQRPYFGFFWMNTFSHNKLNSLSRMDDKVHKFLEGLQKNHLLNNTLVLFFSDHGLRFGEMRYTRTGWLEERLPILFMSLPEWFKHTYPKKYRSLLVNQNRLTTPYDVYMMLQELLVISGSNYTVKPSSGCPNCKSLFQKMKVNRSCEDASIEQHWCTCSGYQEISKGNSTVIKASKYIMNKIHEVIRSYSKDSEKCDKFAARRVISASISNNGKNWYKNDTYLLIVLQTIPNAVFEGTVSVKLKGKTLDFKMEGSISRLDSYRSHSNCIEDSILKKYCYCKR